MQDCTEALRIKGSSCKALYRRAVALENIGDFDDALQDYDAALAVSVRDASG